MSTAASSGSGQGARSVTQRSLAERFERAARSRQTTLAAEARTAARQRVADAENLLRRNPFPDIEPGADQDIASSGIREPASQRRTMRARQEVVEVHEDSSSHDIERHKSLQSHTITAEEDDQAEWPESSTSFQTTVSSPHPSLVLETNQETGENADTNAIDATILEETNDINVDASMPRDVRVQTLVQELRKVKEDQRSLGKDLDKAKMEISDLRNQLSEAEERVAQAPCDPMTIEAYRNLLSMFHESQGQRRELEVQLDQADEREKKLRQELRQTREDVEHHGDAIRQLNYQLTAASLERDQHAQTVAALQHQLSTSRQHQGVQVDHFGNLMNHLNRATQDREQYARRVAELEEQLRQQQHNTRTSTNGRDLLRYDSVDPGPRGIFRSRQIVETRNGLLCVVRRS